MKIVKKSLLVCGGLGNVEMVPLDADDLWLIYNLIAIGDSVTGVTVRKVVKENSKKGDSERVKLKLEIKVDKIPDYDQEGSVVRVTGKNATENEHVKQGAYHTLQLELNRPFVLKKKNWDSVALQELNQACDPAASADLTVVIMQEGLGHIMLVGRSMTITRAKIETSIPRGNKHERRALFLKARRFQHRALCRAREPRAHQGEQFQKHLLLEAERKNLRQIIENKSKIVLVHTSSGNKHSLKEVLDAPNVMNHIKDTKAAREVRALQEFQSMLSSDEHRVCYGPKHVELAHEQMAVKTLLITDELFRNADVATRRKYVHLVDSVKGSKGEVHVFSSMHVSGEQLAQLTGVAAILRFPLPELEDI